MADQVHTDSPPTMTALVQGIVNDAQQLIRQELTLARAEIKKDWKDLKEAGAALSVGGVLSLLGGIFMLLMVVFLLHEAGGIERMWVCYLIVGGVVGIVGSVLLIRGVKKLNSIELGPEKTIESIKEII
jgi:hypothetical protein